jgi:hypothetical protein
MKTRHILICFLLALSLTAAAQRRKARVPQPTPEEIAHQEKLASMRAATAKVMFIDSIVVDKASFLQHYILNPAAGRIETYQQAFKSNRYPNGYVYTPEIGKRYLSQQNNEGIINLYYSENVGNRWTRPTKVRGINDDKRFSRVNYPFMMGDGEVFYFAADGPEGLGGYDIYISRYNAEKGRFLQPENIGMPFNSEANDYMYVVDEYDTLGWFATDRNQPEGKVCIYTFIPQSIRQTYDSEEYTPEQIASFAGIQSIAATWDDKPLLEAALQRKQMAALRKRQRTTDRDFNFVINDDLTYTHYSDFRVAANKGRIRQLLSLNSRYRALNSKLSKVRDYYPTTRGDIRAELREEIIASEQKQHELAQQIRQLEKTIRNTENTYLKEKK